MTNDPEPPAAPSTPRISPEDLIDICAGASFGDSKARVKVGAYHEEDPLFDVAVALNILLDDLNARSAEALAAERAQADLQRRRYQFLAETIPAQVWTANDAGEYSFVNRRMARFIGVGLRSDTPTSASDFVHPDDRETLNEAWATAARERSELSVEVRLRGGTGDFRWFAVRANLWRDPVSGRDEWFGTHIDVDDLHRARIEAEAATRAKARFLASMSHEIRTPMNAVIGLTGVLLEDELTKQQEDFLTTIRRSGDHLLSLINDILDFSKIEAGELTLERYAFDLFDEVAMMVEIAAPPAVEKGIDIALLVDESAPRKVIGDAGRLRQIGLNLLSNAVKFTDSGEVTLSVSARDEDAAVVLSLAVSDTGPGMDAEGLSRLFTPFTQLTSVRGAPRAGTGLGLAISQELARLMDGGITVKSTVGRGSCFTAEVRLAASPDVAPELRLPFEGEIVLVATDTASTRALISWLTRWGGSARRLESPMRLLGYLRRAERPPSVVVIDEERFGTDIPDLLEALEERGKFNTSLLVMTSAPRAVMLDGRELATLKRPVRPSQLYDAMLSLRPASRSTSASQRFRRSPSASVDPKLASRQPMRILLVEDNRVNQVVACALLERFGYKPAVAGDGREAVEMATAERYDLIFMDMEMPVMGGLDATRIILALGHVPPPHIVAMSANVMAEDRQACEEAGMQGFVPKPVGLVPLGELLRSVGRSRRSG